VEKLTSVYSFFSFRVQQVDEDLLMHLLKMQELGAFEDSLVIVMADHGARFSELRQTHQGVNFLTKFKINYLLKLKEKVRHVCIILKKPLHCHPKSPLYIIAKCKQSSSALIIGGEIRRI
jgi:membrane-anchored protein YejM (alkaline phosphatase superfamily)